MCRAIAVPVAVALVGGISGCGSSEGGDVDASDPAGITVRVRATTEAFPHADGLSGMTPRKAGGGVRSLQLLRMDGDPAPVTLFDLGATSAEVGYSDGDDTKVTVVDPQRFEIGTYTMARMVQSHSRYEVDATFHDASGATRGWLDNLQVLSDGTRVDGALRDAGYYRYVFHFGGQEQETTGDDAFIAPFSFTAGARAVVENGEWAVYFPIDLEITAPPEIGSKLVLVINMNESFRWVDSASPGYVDGEFDFTSDSFEHVERFGGNRFELIWE